MSDTNEMQLTEDWSEDQEPYGQTGDDAEQPTAEGWSQDQYQEPAADEQQAWTGDQEQPAWTGEYDQAWAGEQQQEYAPEQQQEYGAYQEQEYGAYEAQGGPADQGQAWAGDQDQALAMYAGDDGSAGAVPAQPAQSTAPINVEFVDGPTLNGIGMDIKLRNLGPADVPEYSVVGTYEVFQRAGTQVMPAKTLVNLKKLAPKQTDEHFIDLENIPGPVMPLPDGAYRVRVTVGIVTRELSFSKKMGKVQP